MTHQTATTSILSLPHSVRVQIYRHAGLMFDANIIIPRQLPLIPQPSSAVNFGDGIPVPFCSNRRTRWPRAKDLHMSSALSLVCKIFHAEVSAVFYSENYFFFQPQSITDLAWLRCLQPTSISHCRHLALRLSPSLCGPSLLYHWFRVDSWFLNAICDTKSNLEDINNIASTLQHERTNLLSILSMGIEHIIRHVTPKTLSLFLECDINNPEIATFLVRPLLNSNHDILAKCYIRLGLKKDPILEALAREAVLHIAGRPPLPDAVTCFPYLRLPSELRQKILEYTDLITPCEEVDWSPKAKYHLSHIDYYDECKNLESCRDSCRFWSCKYHPESGCFCKQHHAAYSIDCRCWSPPRSFFQVCKTMQEDAETVFFGQNRIIIKCAGSSRVPPETNPVRLDLSEFFKTSVRWSALQHIRDLELTFPPLGPNYCATGPVLEDWKEVIKLIKQHMSLPELTIRVYMKCDYEQDDKSDADTPEDHISKLFATQNRVLMPFSDLIGLNRLYLHLQWPGLWEEPDPEMFDQFIAQGDPSSVVRFMLGRREYAQRMCAVWDEEMGRKIMGDDYERSQVGKKEERHSNWYQSWHMTRDDPGI